MIREVDLVSYLPPFMQAYKEPSAALDAENPEFQLLWEAADRILQNRFISTADEYGISRFEKLLGLFPDPADTLEVRRARVSNRWFYGVPYTLKTLSEKLAEILGGEHNFSILPNFKNGYGLTLTVYTLDDSQVGELQYVLSVMVPENMHIDIVFESALVGTIFFGGIMEEADILEIRQR